ncbi:MAG: ABC transporter ATP-binding protein [Actinomycetota bacterium]
MTDPPAVALRGLHKKFGTTYAVQGIDLDVPVGSFFGLVGPNGAGKTTTLSMTTGLLRPDYGTAFINGFDVWADPVRAKSIIGVLPDGLRLFERLTGRELLLYGGLLRSMPPAVVGQRADELIHVLGLDDAAGSLVVDYSHGMRKKIGLAAALLHGPRVVFLDEPFEGVDPVSARTIKAVLESFVTGGGTVVFSSHVMELVENLCDRLAVVDSGKIVATGTIDEVRGGRRLEDVFADLVGAEDTSTEGLAWLRSSSG